MEAFADQMRVLRRECAWKREQTHTSLIPYVREEAEEVVEAIESGDPAALCDELGDLLLQVVIHAVIAEEAGDFTLDDVARGVIAKMERRNPHVFGDAVATDAAEVQRLWNAAKAARGRTKPATALKLVGRRGTGSEPRNPHVFGDAVATDVAEVMRLYDAAKAAEKQAAEQTVEQTVETEERAAAGHPATPRPRRD